MFIQEKLENFHQRRELCCTLTCLVSISLHSSTENQQITIIVKEWKERMWLELLQSHIPRELSLFDLYDGSWIFPGSTVIKNPPANVGDVGSIPGLGWSPGVENGNPLQYSCLENSMDGGAGWATVHIVTTNWTRLSDSLRWFLRKPHLQSHPYLTWFTAYWMKTALVKKAFSMGAFVKNM